MRPALLSSRWLCLAALLSSAAASAGPNDFQLRQLGNPLPNGAGANPAANANFRIFARELGAAINSTNLMPPETLGHSGFAVNAELSLVHLKTDEFIFPTQETFGGPLLLPSIHLRKGLPFSFEVGSRVGWLDKSRMGVVSVEGKWALNEGFAYLPDVGLRGHVSRLVNSRDFHLTTMGLDVGVGKQLAVGGMVTLTPYVGWNLVWVSAQSNTVDFRPDRTFSESVATPDAPLRDTAVFDDVDFGPNGHNRFYGGLRFIGGVVQLGLEVSLSTLGKLRVPTGPDTTEEKTLPAVTAVNTTFGLDF